jgi:arylsulfatase A-like enzyme
MKRLVAPWMGRGGVPARDARAAEEQAEPGPVSMVGLALWLGIVVGLAEVGELIAVRRITRAITSETLRTNWHYAWMVPASYVILFGALGLLLGGLACVSRGRFGYRAAIFALSLAAALPLVMAIPGLHWLAVLVLAVGVSARVGSWLAARPGGLCRLVQWTLPVLAIATACLVARCWWTVSTAERRALAALPEPAPRVPNVLLIVLDTVRFDGVFPEAPARDPTPFLTWLSGRGVRFDEARSTAPWTLPSHASMFTGQWPHRMTAALGRPLDAAHTTIAEYLSERGYTTAGFVGNACVANAWYGLDRGFARYEDFYENTTVTGLEVLRSSRLGSAFLMSKIGQKVIRWMVTPPKYVYRKSAAMINRDALAWLDRKRSDRPFFMFLNYFDAHDPYVPPPGTPLTYTRADPNDHRPMSERARDMYDDCLAYLDDQLERLFGELERRGVLHNTLVIVTADHGEEFGEHELMGHGVSLYRQEMHVPLVVLLPSGAGRGLKVTGSVSLREIPATIAEYAGPPNNSSFPGESLARYWRSDAGPPSDTPILAEVDQDIGLLKDLQRAPNNRGPVKSVITDGHVFIRNGDGGEELYDLDDDLGETTNEAADPHHDPPIEHFRATLDRLLGAPDRRPGSSGAGH